MPKWLTGGLLLALMLTAIPIANAESNLVGLIDIFIDTATLEKGYTVSSPDDHFFVGMRPEVLAVETRVVVKEFQSSQFTFPDGLKPISEVYEFDIFNKAAFQDEKPLMLKFLVKEPTLNYKRIYFYNGVIDEWVELPSYADGPDKVKSMIHLPYAKMVILSTDVMTQGAASWYKYRGCDCAASPDYPKGTELLVTNEDNGKSVVITVNDFGPERDIHPDRVIDLDSVAFKKLGELWQGILPNVSVERYTNVE